jgi:hypothetical protein
MARCPEVVLAFREVPWDGNEQLLEDVFRREVRAVLQHFNHLYVFGTAPGRCPTASAAGRGPTARGWCTASPRGGQEMFVTVDRLDCYTDGCRSVVFLQEKVKRDA